MPTRIEQRLFGLIVHHYLLDAASVASSTIHVPLILLTFVKHNKNDVVSGYQRRRVTIRRFLILQLLQLGQTAAKRNNGDGRKYDKLR